MPRNQSVDERFWSKVSKSDAEDGCWIWKGNIQPSGYGYFALTHSKNVRAHRYAYEITKGPIPEGMTIDHKCNNRACVNPAHLEIATYRENILRSNGLGAINARRQFCSRGHKFTEENTKIVYRKGVKSRLCLVCFRTYQAQYYRHHRERKIAQSTERKRAKRYAASQY